MGSGKRLVDRMLKKSKRQPGLSDLTETMPQVIPMQPKIIPMNPAADLGVVTSDKVDLNKHNTTVLMLTPDQTTPGIPTAQRVGPQPVDQEMVKALCGHTVSFDLYAKDRFRNERRKKITDRKCGACRDADNKLRMQQDAVEKAARDTNKPKKPRNRKPRKPFWLKPNSAKNGKLWGRLPHGAEFHVRWDAEKREWIGVPGLTVPNFHGQDLTFGGSGNGVFWLLPQLDMKFRQWWRENHPEEERVERERFVAEMEAHLIQHRAKQLEENGEIPQNSVDDANTIS